MYENDDWRIRFEDKIDRLFESISAIKVQSERISNVEEKNLINKKSLDKNWDLTREIEKKVQKLKNMSATIWCLLIPLISALIALTFKLVLWL